MPSPLFIPVRFPPDATTIEKIRAKNLALSVYLANKLNRLIIVKIECDYTPPENPEDRGWLVTYLE